MRSGGVPPGRACVEMWDYEVKSLTSFEAIEAVRCLWETKQAHPLADYELYDLVVQIRANVVTPCTLVALCNAEPVTLLAGRIETAKMPIRFGYATLMEIPVRQLVLIGGGFLGDRTEAIWQRLLIHVDDLLLKHQIDLAIFEQLRIGAPEFEALKRVFNLTRLCPVQDTSKHWLLKLPPTWDGFLKTRSRKHRYWLQRLYRVLDREFTNQWEIQFYSTPSEANEFVDAADKVANTTYQRSLRVGFRRNEETLLRVELDARRGQLRGYVLFIKNEPKAFWYCSTYKGTLHLVATGYDPAYRIYELGTVLLMKVFQDNCGKEIEVIDFGLGDADYKRRFGSEYFEEGSFYLFSRTARGLLLGGFVSTITLGVKVAKRLLDRLNATQRLKTYWRRRLEQQHVTTGST
jgi:hypothetical protein